jgi:hypothetical protein
MVGVNGLALLIPNVDVGITWFVIRTGRDIPALENKRPNNMVVQSAWGFLLPNCFEVNFFILLQVIDN